MMKIGIDDKSHVTGEYFTTAEYSLFASEQTFKYLY
jgi:hypothetical protein